MKNVTYNKRELSDRGRVISIRESHEDKECRTRVMKNFLYLARREDSIPSKQPPPRIFIRKIIDTEGCAETFIFKVKGQMHVKEKRFIFCVEYCHSLVVRMFWKDRIRQVKPAKPAALA